MSPLTPEPEDEQAPGERALSQTPEEDNVLRSSIVADDGKSVADIQAATEAPDQQDNSLGRQSEGETGAGIEDKSKFVHAQSQRLR